ncbi:NUDIX domain-containing protein [Muriicola jejuensis]|uniref:NUDIX domain-containing protein n=2 Tax=Muriicola jejuensis TaxID=504488 RepID=A0A6P0UBI0_9FLAO|nr:CoA pyrophosphatase [Muriicola jejuensis]NER08988.1 NUDIX domain-containing protein [Muriicola jejuensis]
MDFKNFAEQIPKIKNLPLPGRQAHYKLAPEMRIRELEAGKIVKKDPRRAGVMALFYPDEASQTRLLLIMRNSYNGIHSRQVAFPGGKQEKEDASLLATALRETWEEVGAIPEQVEVVREVSDVYIPPSNFEVRPFVGLYHRTRPFVLQPEEVDHLIEVPLIQVLDDAFLTSQILSTSYAKNIEVPAFYLQGYTVWGATAMMLNEIRELIKQVL